MKAYFYSMEMQNRKGGHIGNRVGVVFADSEDEAEEKAWALAGSDFGCKLWVEEVDERGYCFTVYS